MNESDLKESIKSIFKDWGLAAYEIPTREDRETPDFEIVGENGKYTLELKIKGDDPDEAEKDLEVLSRGEILTKSTPVGPRNRLQAIIKKGVDQIKEHDPRGRTYHLLWIQCIGQDPELLKMRFRATLFGTQDLFSIEKNGGMECFFFNESAFYTHRLFLDGAILVFHDQLQLCVNTLSPRKGDFQQSDLYKILSSGLCDPDILQREEYIFIADCDIDRGDKDRVLNYLRNKYKVNHLQTIDMKKHSGKMLIPESD